MLCLISPLEVERSKWLSYEEWLESVQKKENQSSEQDKVVITQFSWADYHQSQTAKNGLIQPDNSYKVVFSTQIGIQNTFIGLMPQVLAHKAHHQNNQPVKSAHPLAFGVVIGAP
jgi:hypothetical protein